MVYPSFCDSHLKSQVWMQVKLALVNQSVTGMIFSKTMSPRWFSLSLIEYSLQYVWKKKKKLQSLKLSVFTLWQAVQLDDILFLWWLLLVILLSCTKAWQTFKQRYDDEPFLVIHSFHYSQRGQCSMTPDTRFAKYRFSGVWCHCSDILHLLVHRPLGLLFSVSRTPWVTFCDFCSTWERFKPLRYPLARGDWRCKLLSEANSHSQSAAKSEFYLQLY